jgi:hypothetical protein
MTNVTTATVTQLLPIASSDKFDVRVSSHDNHLLVYREDTSTCIVDIALTPEQIAQIKAAQFAN